MSDQKQLFLFGQSLPPGNDTLLLDRIKDCSNYRNRNGTQSIKALEDLPAENIQQIVVGNNHVAFLLKDHRVARLSFDIVETKVETTDKAPPGTAPTTTAAATVDNSSSNNRTTTDNGNSMPSSYAAAASAAANRTAKIRRVMMAARRPGGFGGRAGVIVDRARPLIPASSIPEELIAQAQVVLQGKSREAIVRELQRTNLNVNEAVNNLLSRDEEDNDDMDEGADAYLPEELLSLLDAGLRSDGAAAILDHDNIYATGEGYEYLIARDMARRRNERMDSKTKDRTSREAEASTIYQDRFVFGDSLQFWTDAKEAPFPTGVKKFVKIVAMHSELLALTDNGLLYGWSWEKKAKGSKSPHPINTKFFGSSKNEQITDIETCPWRAVILTDLGRIGSFMDLSSCGKKISDAFFSPLVQLPVGETVVSLHVCSIFAAVRFTNNSMYWWGVYPFNERRKLWERARSRSRKHVTFDTSEIVVGSEVRTKSNPIYAAGSVAINFSSGTPQIGTLMESAWTLNETCRFRVQTPEQYDKTADEKPNQLSLRKRAAPSDEATSASSATANSGSAAPSIIKESAWSLKDVIFIKEESVNDTAIVKLIDGAQCGIIYKSTLEKEADSLTSSELLSKMRIIRKDDLVLVSPNNKTPRSPENFERTLKEIHLPQGVKRIVAMTIDNTGFRVLVEKKGRAHLLRISCLGKLLSDHLIPLNLSILCTSSNGSAEKSRPTLENCGDESMLYLRDANGALVPLVRNALGGYREPTFIGMSPVHSFSIGLKYLKSTSEVSSALISSAPVPNVTAANARTAHGKYANRMALVAALVAPSPESVQPQVQSIIQLILYCDVKGVKETLDLLAKEDVDEKTKRRSIVEARIDGNRTVFHAAVMFAFASSNREQADVEPGTGKEGESAFDTAAADATRAEYDEKWKSMVRGAGQGGDASSAMGNYVRDLVVKVTESMQEFGEGLSSATGTSGSSQQAQENMDESTSAVSLQAPRVVPKPTSGNKERQANAIEIIKILANHPVIREKYFTELMAIKDINGQTPFMCAVQNRAYTAASVLWKAIEESYPSSTKTQMSAVALPNNSRADDSPLFVLCYNDTCSFTWTGDEHINQDIFECKTCGLTGTLCCCTECAFTCHRNHDCKLKRTSPTAYCDCWEKCSCKALVTGNETQREALLKKMIEKTDLISSVNARGDHLLLFLARTVGRQLVEQDNFIRRLAKIRANQPNTTNEVPERDLEPPKFSRKAFQLCLQNWSAVKSLITIGMKHMSEETLINEEIFHLSEQHGSTHLDKFVFILLARCQENHLDALLNTLISEANKSNRDPEVDDIISRFVRSVVRLFSLISVLSPAAAGITIAAIASLFDTDPGNNKFSTSTSGPSNGAAGQSSAKTIVSNYRAVSISGMLSLVRTSLPVSLTGSSMKENKKKNLTSFVLKCRRVFQVLISHSLNELINTMDALMSPVTHGIVQPTALVSRGIGSNADVLEIMEKYLNVEQDFSSYLLGSDDSQKTYRRRRLETRRDTEDENAANANDTIGSQEAGANADSQSPESENDSDSESDADVQSRRFDSQGSLGGGHTDEAHESSRGEAPRRPDYGDSTDSLSSASDDEEDDASEDDEDDDDDRRRAGEYNDDEEDFYGEEEDEEDSSGDEAPDPYGDDEEFEEENQNVANEEREEASDPNSNNASSNNEDQHQRRGSGSRRSRRGGRSRNSRPRSNNEEMIPERNDVDIPLADDPREPQPPADSEFDNIPHPNLREEIDRDAVVVVNPVSFEIESNSNSNHAEAMDTSHPLQDRPTEESSRQQSGETFHTPPQSFRDDEIDPWNIAPSGDSSRTSTAPSLNWAVRRVRNDGTSSFRDSDAPPSRATEVDNSESSAPERATQQAPDTTGPPPGTTRHVRHKEVSGNGDDLNSSTNKTDMQLTVAFSLILKLVDELMLQLAQHKEWQSMEQAGINGLLKLEPNTIHKFKELLEGRLNTVWIWLKSVLDKTEAQLKFGNALSTSAVGHLITLEAETAQVEIKKPDEKRYRKKMDLNSIKKGSIEDHTASGTTRKDFCSYFMSLMRSHSSENGDALPIIEYKALRSVAFVAEAFLFHINALDLLDAKLVKDEDIQMIDVDEDPSGELKPDGKSIRRFYQRSNSICYPYISAADTHHAFKYVTEQCLPLAIKPYLLQPAADKSSLFALPLPLRTKKGHKQVAIDHGIDNPTHHSFANPPSDYGNILKGNKDAAQATSSQATAKPKEEQRPNVIVHSSDVANTPGLDLEHLFGTPTSVARISLQKYLGRWSNTLLFMSKAFHEELTNFSGGDASFSVLLMETAGFHVRQSQFRKKMEKFKMSQTKDLSFSQMSRDKTSLLSQTMRQLNQQYARRISSNSTTASPSGSTATFSALKAAARGIEPPPNNPPLASNKIKVTFMDEPGEGTGVARSFYTAVADAFLTMPSLPSEGALMSGDLGSGFDDSQGGGRSTSPTFQLLSRFSRRSKNQAEDNSGSLSNALPPASNSEDRGVRTRSQRATTNQTSSASSTPASSSRKYSRKAKYPLTLTAPAYYPKAEGQETGEPSQDRASEPPTSGFQLQGQSSSSSVASAPPSTRSRQTEMNTMLLGDRILSKVRALQPEYANKITGIFLDLQLTQVMSLISNEENFRAHVEEAAELLKQAGFGTPGATELKDEAKIGENAPLFFKPSKGGYYTPIAATNSPQRLAAFRNVGRMIGISLQQMEIFPLHVCRHVLKFILGRPITWFDLAFYDPAMFDSLRSIVYNDSENTAQTNEFYESLQLTFAVDLSLEEGGGVIELKPDGENIPVTRENVLEYIYLFVQYRLLGNHVKALEAIKQGVFDVIPPESLANLTAEDMRLIMCGTHDVSIPLLKSYTTFLDESSAPPDVLTKFKETFWATVEKFSPEEKSDLIFFWHGSFTLPSSEESFQPLPTIMIRPADDHHLPTANTCISRLYIPLYSSKKILRSKLLLAIKARNFGFV